MIPALLWCALGLISQPKKLTVAEVVKIASTESKAVKIAELEIDVAEARTSATRALALPSLRTDGNIFVWNEQLAFSLAPEGTPPEDDQPVVVREQVTAQLNVTVAQPLTGLIAVLGLVDIEKLGREAAEIGTNTARLDAAQRAVEAFLRSLQARALLEVAEKSLKQVDAQLENARVLENAGVLGAVDLLRIEALRASVLQAVLQAKTGRSIADGTVLLALDWPQGTEIDPVDDLPDPAPKVELVKEVARRTALERRPELAAAKTRVLQADEGTSVAWAGFVPNLVAIGTYQHSEGNGIFLPRDSAFGGATLSWTVFDWLRPLDQVHEAEARLAQARLAAEAVADQVELDVEIRSTAVTNSYESLGVAAAGLRASEEAYRIQSARYQQGAATTTDLLDAETDLARARANGASARYEHYIALAGLARALGQLPAITPAGLGE